MHEEAQDHHTQCFFVFANKAPLRWQFLCFLLGARPLQERVPRSHRGLIQRQQGLHW